MRASSVLIALLILGAGAATGWVAGSLERGSGTTPDEMASAVRSALARDEPVGRVAELSRLFAGLRTEQLPGALVAYEERLGGAGHAELVLLAHAWARLDPAAAYEHLMGWPAGKRQHAVPAVLYTWATRAPEEAVRASDSIAPHEDPGLAEKARVGLLNGWVDSGLPGVEDFVASLPRGELRRELTAALVQRSGERDGTEAAMRWVETLAAGQNRSLKRTAFRETARFAARRDPAHAARWVEDHLDANYAEGSVRIVARSWVLADPIAALDWLLGLPDSRERDDAVEDAFGRWLAVDDSTAEDWISRIDPTPALDSAFAALAFHTAPGSPEAAAAWCARIHDPDHRARCTGGGRRSRPREIRDADQSPSQ